MTRLSWLHLSDLRMSLKGSRWLWPEYREEFERDLRQLHERTGPWDLVLISGDLTLNGRSEEFDLLTRTLESLWECLRGLGSDPTLLAVPGSHDLNRARFGPSERVGPKTQVYPPTFMPFSKWLDRWHDTHRPDRVSAMRSGRLPGDFAATVVKEGLKVTPFKV